MRYRLVRLERLALALAAAAAIAGCASTSSVQWSRSLAPRTGPPAGPVFVMAPTVAGSAAPGNVGRDFPAIQRAVLTRILDIVRERYPNADVAAPGSDGVRRAREAGATDVIVTEITAWTEMRTDDPVGAFTVPRNRITVTLRLMRLEPLDVVGIVTFSNHARLTLNQRAERLLDARFRDTVLCLIGTRIGC